MNGASGAVQKRDFWSLENLKYSQPHYRMRKVARVLNHLADEKPCRLLDVGCGPAALRHLLDPNIAYHGVDIAIKNPRRSSSSVTSSGNQSPRTTRRSIWLLRRDSSSTCPTRSPKSSLR